MTNKVNPANNKSFKLSVPGVNPIFGNVWIEIDKGLAFIEYKPRQKQQYKTEAIALCDIILLQVGKEVDGAFILLSDPSQTKFVIPSDDVRCFFEPNSGANLMEIKSEDTEYYFNLKAKDWVDGLSYTNGSELYRNDIAEAEKAEARNNQIKRSPGRPPADTKVKPESSASDY